MGPLLSYYLSTPDEPVEMPVTTTDPPDAPVPTADPPDAPVPTGDPPDAPVVMPVTPPDTAVLATFLCPFQEHQRLPPSKCPFSHRFPPPSLNRHLRPIPLRFCIDFLLSKCTSDKLERLYPGQIVKCEFGFHPSQQDFIDPEQFVPFMTEAILGKPIEYRNELVQPQENVECAICINPIPTLSSPTNGCALHGLLENCSHKFCSKCILDWRTNQQTLDGPPHGTKFFCPNCREPSSRIMLWPVHCQSLYGYWLQKKLFKIYLRSCTSVCVKEIQEATENHLIELRFENRFERIPRSSFRPVNDNQTVPPIKTPNRGSTSAQSQLQVPLDPNVLTKFRCLFQHQDRPPYCSLQSTCPFGHHDPDIDATNVLRSLLQCFCLEFLLNKCVSTKLERFNRGEMIKCDSGFHPSPKELLEPENFARQVASAVHGFGALNYLFKHLGCAGCSKRIPTMWYEMQSRNDDSQVGLLENCVHCICFDCIWKWNTRITSLNKHFDDFHCAMCDTTSSRIMLWPAPVQSPSFRAHLFKLQKECFGLLVGPRTKVVIKQVNDDDVHDDENLMQYMEYMIEINGLTCRGNILNAE